jgi:hypothetical protein
VRIGIVFLAILSAVSCGKGPPDAAEYSFSAVIPDGWHVVREEPWSPDQLIIAGPEPRIYITRYPSKVSDNYSDALKYAESFWMLDPKGKPPVIEKKTMDGHLVIFFHREQTHYKLHSKEVFNVTREKYALIPLPGGFIEVHQSVPVDDVGKYERGFISVAGAIKPKI